jgi:hypothetical protein
MLFYPFGAFLDALGAYGSSRAISDAQEEAARRQMSVVREWQPGYVTLDYGDAIATPMVLVEKEQDNGKGEG